MKLPLIILAIMAVIAGFIPFAHFVTSDGALLETPINYLFSVAPVLLAVAGIGLATVLYKSQNGKPDAVAVGLGGFYKAAYHKFYIDELYLFITKKVIFNLIGRPAAWFDKNIVDGTMNVIATLTAKLSVAIKGFQSGKVQNYALYFFGGIAVLAVLFIYIWK